MARSAWSVPSSSPSDGYTIPNLSDILNGNLSAGSGNPIGDKNYWNTMGGRIGAALWPSVASQIQNVDALTPGYNRAVTNYVSAFDPSNLQKLLSNWNLANDQATQARLGGIANAAQSAGLGSGAVQGAQMNALNQSAKAQNANIASVLSPQGLQQLLGTQVNAYNQAMNPQTVALLRSLMGSTPATVSSGDGWSSTLGGLAGLASSFF